MMLVPNRDFYLFDDIFGDPFFRKSESKMMKTDIREDKDNYVIDNNGMQIDNYTDQINSLINPAKKWESFGFYAQTINGNDISEIDEAIENAKKQKDKPSIIVLNTVKGKGVSFIEKLGVANHSTTISKEQLEEALEELK